MIFIIMAASIFYRNIQSLDGPQLQIKSEIKDFSLRIYDDELTYFEYNYELRFTQTKL